MNKEALIARIDAYIDAYMGSRTDENAEFVRGIIYGLNISKAGIEAAFKGSDTE